MMSTSVTKERITKVLSIVFMYALLIHEFAPLAMAIGVSGDYNNHYYSGKTPTAVEVAKNDDSEMVESSMVQMSVSNGPGQGEIQGSTANQGGNLVNTFTGDLSYSIPLLDVEGFPIVLSYDPNIGMDQEASWVGLGWNLSLGSINRQMRGIPDDFQGDEIVRTSKSKANTIVGQGWSVNFHGGFGNPVFLKETGFQVSPGGGVDMKKGFFPVKVSGGFSFASGKYFNNYTGEGRTRSFNMQGSLGLGLSASAGPASLNANASLSGGIGFSSDTQNGKGASLYGGFNTSASASIFGTGPNGGYGSSSALSTNSRTGTVSKMKSGYGVEGNSTLLVYSSGSITSRGSHRTFGTASFVPRFNSPNYSTNVFTQTDVNLSGQYYAIYAGVGGGGNDYSTVSSVVSYESKYPGYGFGHHSKGQSNDKAMLDFNRDRNTAMKSETRVLSFSTPTYDVYMCSGPGFTSMFRPYRYDVTEFHDPKITSTSISKTNENGDIREVNVNGGIGISGSATGGVSVTNQGAFSETESSTSSALQNFQGALESETFDRKEYALKTMGEVQPVNVALFDAFGGNNATAPKIDGNTLGLSGLTSKVANNTHQDIAIPAQNKNFSMSQGVVHYRELRMSEIVNGAYSSNITGAVVCDGEIPRVVGFDGSIISDEKKDHHTGAIEVVSASGMRYEYGLPMYSLEQKEVSFSVSERFNENFYAETGLVQYQTGDNSVSNNLGRYGSYQNTITPGYASAFLLTSMFSSDYIDRTGDGPTPDDQGMYYELNYTSPYNAGSNTASNGSWLWRMPMCSDETNSQFGDAFNSNLAYVNKNMHSDAWDENANYISGKKEVWYSTTIESKNMIAFFCLEDREDQFSMKSENGGLDLAKPGKLLKKIMLFSKNDLEQNPSTAKALKVVEFKYDYSLCKGYVGNKNAYIFGTSSTTEQYATTGKLTLKAIYTYTGESTEIKTLPMKFEYGSGLENPDFAFNSTDRWGCYKPNDTQLPNQEFPYALQENQLANQNIQAWKLKEVEVTGGAKTEFNYETDDYSYVQNKRAMRMFDVVAMSNTDQLREINGGTPDGQGGFLPGTVISGASLNQINNDILSFRNPEDKKDHYNIIYFKLDEPVGVSNASVEIREKYLTQFNPDGSSERAFKVYFNMYAKLDNRNEDDNNTSYDERDFGYEYVESEVELGYIDQVDNICGGAGIPNANNEYEYAWLVVQPTRLDDLIDTDRGYLDNASEDVLNKANVEPPTGDDYFVNPLQVANWQFAEQNVPCAIYGKIQYDATNATDFCDYSLQNDVGVFGGNLYEKLNRKEYALKFDPLKSRIRLYEPDNRKFGGNCRIASVTIHDNWDIYSQEYNTSYTYNYDYDQITASNGVAAYEPQIGNNENPFYTFTAFDISRNRLPDERVYQKEPWGDMVFPGPNVGYEEVTASIFDGTVVGYNVNQFYTYKEVPTIVDRTEIASSRGTKVTHAGNSAIVDANGFVKEEYAFSQGFYVETSDFHGKTKMSSTYGSQGELISSSEVIYYDSDAADMKFVSENGTIGASYTPRDVDIHFDSWNSKSLTLSDREGNTTSIGFTLVGSIPIPILGFNQSTDEYVYENESKAYTLSKVVNHYAVPREIITTYLGAENSARNLYFDSETGQVLASSVTDEYNDELYSMNYPAHWKYTNFDRMSISDGAVLTASELSGNASTLTITNSIHDIEFRVGDQLTIDDGNQLYTAWVLEMNTGVAMLIDNTGASLSGVTWNAPNLSVKIEQTGSKNILNASIMGINSKKAPIENSGILEYPTTEVLSSYAMRFEENKNVACIPLSAFSSGNGGMYPVEQYEPGEVINPFLVGTLGNYRMTTSFSFQNERDASNINDVRQDGDLSNYQPFYAYNNGEWYAIDEVGHPNNGGVGELNDWREQGKVDVYDEFGKPLQATDQIDIISAVQYGLSNNLKLRVKASAVNAKSSEIGFDGFEDYNYFVNNNLNYEDYGFALQPVSSQIVSSQKHSGRYSLLVSGSESFDFDIRQTITDEPNIVAGQYQVKECNCLQGFAPEISGDYVFSTWVHEDTKVYPFTQSNVTVSFLDQGGVTISSTSFSPDGAVIDGWQKIEGRYVIPAGTAQLRFTLNGQNTSYFDDFRTHPFLAGMTTTVYDQETLLLMAEHDGYNYTTFYNYDDNYQLVRVRVETIEGIKTVSESETGSFRQQ